MSNEFLGKYRGLVADNMDPLMTGRIRATVPDVLGSQQSGWALPCAPFGGSQTGFFAIPTVGAGVWIEFEQGDPDYPIWTGCFWGSASEVPSLAQAGNPVMPSIILQSGLQHVIAISDMPGPVGGITLKTATGAMILINDLGITISNGKGASIVMTGPNVTINNGALVVI
jgi:uncharacterized protein involved in type VI secretion and phage assembly